MTRGAAMNGGTGCLASSHPALAAGETQEAATTDPRLVAAVTRTSAGNRRTGAAEIPATGATRGARIPGGIPGGEVVEITRAAGPLLPGLTTLVQAVTAEGKLTHSSTPETRGRVQTERDAGADGHVPFHPIAVMTEGGRQLGAPRRCPSAARETSNLKLMMSGKADRGAAVVHLHDVLARRLRQPKLAAVAARTKLPRDLTSHLIPACLKRARKQKLVQETHTATGAMTMMMSSSSGVSRQRTLTKRMYYLMLTWTLPVETSQKKLEILI